MEVGQHNKDGRKDKEGNLSHESVNRARGRFLDVMGIGEDPFMNQLGLTKELLFGPSTGSQGAQSYHLVNPVEADDGATTLSSLDGDDGLDKVDRRSGDGGDGSRAHVDLDRAGDRGHVGQGAASARDGSHQVGDGVLHGGGNVGNEAGAEVGEEVLRGGGTHNEQLKGTWGDVVSKRSEGADRRDGRWFALSRCILDSDPRQFVLELSYRFHLLLASFKLCLDFQLN